MLDSKAQRQYFQSSKEFVTDIFSPPVQASGCRSSRPVLSIALIQMHFL